MTIREALRSAIRRLEEAATASPGSEAEELLGRLLGMRRAELYASPRSLEPAAAETLARWVERRRAGEPVQYVTGWAAFRQLDLRVTPAVLVPRPETEGLVECVLEVLRAEAERWPAPRVLDLGTGSGAIALALATEAPAAIVTATDASEAALEVARGNAARLGLADRVRLLRGHWFGALEPGERFEVVVANPPYVAEEERALLPADVREHEPAAALFSGPTGLEALREIVREAPGRLVAGGLLALELAESRAAEVLRWLEAGGAWRETRLRSDLAGRPRVALARRA